MVMHWGKGCGERGKALKRVGERDKCATQTRTDTHRRPRTHTRTLSLSPFASLLLLRQGPRVCSHGCWRQLLLPQHKRKQMPARQVPLPSKNRHTHTDTHRHRQTHTDTHTHRHTHTDTHTHTHIHTAVSWPCIGVCLCPSSHALSFSDPPHHHHHHHSPRISALHRLEYRLNQVCSVERR